MHAQLDHLVIGGTDLGLLVGWWHQVAGSYPARGGSHAGYGTRNALVGVDDHTYVELIAIDPEQEEPAAPRPFGIDALEPNSAQLCTYVLAVGDIAAATAAVRGTGLDPGPIREMTRARADGTELTWQLAIPPDPRLGGTLPGLIQWGPGVPHPGSSLDPVVRIEELVVGHPEAAELQAALDAVGSGMVVTETPAPMVGAHLRSAAGADFRL